ncbi:MAG TPA: PQQ-binding-like beta-propeller repeat protein [Gemmataceae bacterium]|nr:PQQ-binding-like beta-propeller repeat protein [Gemmataceae bacterium]
MPKRLCWCVALLLLVGVAALASRDDHFQPHQFDWPQWQGPQRNAISQEKGLLQKWPEEGPPLVWRAEGVGGGYSAPSVAAGRVFGLGFVDSDEVVWALDEQNGHQLWSTPIGPARWSGSPQGKAGPHSTPTVAGNVLFAEGINGDVVCLEAATGKLHWRKSLPHDFGGKMMSRWGWSESPLVDDNKVVVTPGGDKATLVALNKDNGEVLWTSLVPGHDKAGYSSVVISYALGVKQYVQLTGSGLIGVRASDGKFLWRYDRMANHTANISTPIVHGDYVFASTAYKGGSALVKLVQANGGIDAQEVWFNPRFQNHHGGVVLVGEYLYGGQGQNQGAPTCLEFETGNVVWQHRAPGSGSAGIAYADGQLYYHYQNGVMALIAATPKGYELNGKFETPDNSGKPGWAHPIIANGKLYVRDQDKLFCYNVKQGG